MSTESQQHPLVFQLGANGSRIGAFRIPRDHIAYKQCTPCPVPATIGMYIGVWKINIKDQNSIETHERHENQPATYLNIEKQSGFAPMPWQYNVGDVLILDLTGKDFGARSFSDLYDWIDYVLDRFGDGDDAAHSEYNQESYDESKERHLAYNCKIEENPAKRCYVCSKIGASQICSACHLTAYCSRECQKKHWKYHKTWCQLAQGKNGAWKEHDDPRKLVQWMPKSR